MAVGSSAVARLSPGRMEWCRVADWRGGCAPQSVWDRRAPPSVSPDVGREPVAHQRVATARLQPYRNNGAGAADAAQPRADPSIRHAADPRRTADRARGDGAAAFAPSGVAWDP